MAGVALVTGGSRGIGFGIVQQLAKQGFNIAINGVRPKEGVTDVLASIKALGVEVIYCQGNVALSDDRAKILQEVKDHYGQLNLLVNNAGIAPRERRDVLSTSETSFDEVLDTNLKSCYFLTQAAANWMIEQKATQPDFSASIINISSISATVASVNRGEYCVSKAGISMVTQLFAVRLGEYNIPVYEVRPGVIATDMTAGVKEKYDNLIGGGLCVQPRWGTPEDVGKAVGALAAGGFPYSTGQVFMVDGGLTLSRL
ncbi:3-ketoacyl-ACP reductase [Haliscomenobacter sp.]|uniref:3-ketoacyl-ACP reductase n=1 Tax=Haliscomenobacter sp. TaxID=2717303 RepID=UPI0035947C9D